MEVGIRQGVCNNSPAESTSPENGWRSSAEPVPDRLGNVVVGPARAFADDRRPRRVGRGRDGAH
ncbi:hypothetical protein M514_27838 [Trichuris suis]|uniref:Uncharacterized protein n=1 Tax=Trichuris suis TaxID=68888 RepID=A0A085MRZ4_9BILA|nr:hypothetical protein M514_27838 [Trichuris suis]